MLFAFGKKSKRIILLAVLCLAATILTGCGASLTVYDYTENNIRYNAYELTIDIDLVEKMESTAATDGNGNKYTVSGYFYELFTDFGYTLESAQKTDKAYTVKYLRAVGGGGELFEYGTAVDYTTTYTENPFVRTYNQTSPNPFNGLRATYDSVLPMRSTTVPERLKNGAVTRDEYGETVVLQPALADAFPYIKGIDPDGLILNYVLNGSSRMQSSGITNDLGDNKSNYIFSRYFDTSDSSIDFKFKRPVTYGWYFVALLAGGATLGVIILITRQKKQKPTLLDRFPYNPEEYRDYDSHLPIKR